MNRKLIIAVSLLLLFVLVFWRLKTLTNGGDSPAEVATVYGPLKFIMTVNETRFNLGEPVNITLIIRNISNETILLGFAYPPSLNFLVYNRSLQIFNYLYTQGGPDVVISHVLNPDETFSRTLQWEQVAMDESPPHIFRQVQCGTYYIRGQISRALFYIGPPDEFDVSNCAGTFTIETPTIELDIL